MSSAPPSTTLDQARANRAALVLRWRKVLACAGLFLMVVGLGMIASHVRLKANDPWKSPVLKELKDQLHAEPKNEAVKEKIRALDLQLRQRYFGILAFNTAGIWFLVGGLTVFIASSTVWSRVRWSPPLPAARAHGHDEALPEARRSRWMVGATTAVVLLLFAGLTLATGTSLPTKPEAFRKLVREMGGETTDEPATIDAASPAEARLQWPRFLGLEGNALAATNAPTRWDAASGAGVVWKVAVPVAGYNSPVVWGERLFLSGGDRARREVVCFNTKDGSIAWRQPIEKVPGSPATVPEMAEMTGYAPGSVATDGRRVYAMFPNGDLAAFTLEGRLVWAKHLGVPDNMYGHTTSLITWQDRVIVQLDQGEPEGNKSRLIALHGRTGQIAWQKNRPVGSSWSTPVAFEAGGRAQIVALAVPWVISYNARDGAELWRVEGMKGEITPSPAFAQGLVFALSPSEKFLAIRPDGNGDVSGTHVAWSASENVPDVTSPVVGGDLAFTLTTSGQVTCFDAKDGKKLWDKELDNDFHASPALAGGHLYLFSQKGLTLVLAAERTFKEVSRTTLPDSFHASPALVGGRLYARGVTNLWCFGGETRVAEVKP